MQKHNSAWILLKLFAEAEPSWKLIEYMSASMVENFVTTTLCLSELQDLPAATCDQYFENQTLQKHDELLYVELCHTMNAGDIG